MRNIPKGAKGKESPQKGMHGLLGEEREVAQKPRKTLLEHSLHNAPFKLGTKGEAQSDPVMCFSERGGRPATQPRSRWLEHGNTSEVKGPVKR
jgi:hypothetical protein